MIQGVRPELHRILRDYQQRTNRHPLVVNGAGEWLLRNLAQRDFDLDQGALELTPDSTWLANEAYWFVSKIPWIPIDDRHFLRPMETPTLFHILASRGCRAMPCGFCPGGLAPSDSISDERLRRELEGLNGFRVIFLESPDLFFLGQRGVRQIETILNAGALFIHSTMVGVLTLSKVINLNRNILQQLRQRGGTFSLGAESVNPDQLIRLEKSRNKIHARDYLDKLKAILTFFDGGDLLINLLMIYADNQTTLPELTQSLEIINRLIEMHPNVGISLTGVGNIERCSPGSPKARRGVNNTDTLRYQDPLALYACLLWQTQWEDILHLFSDPDQITSADGIPHDQATLHKANQKRLNFYNTLSRLAISLGQVISYWCSTELSAEDFTTTALAVWLDEQEDEEIRLEHLQQFLSDRLNAKHQRSLERLITEWMVSPDVTANLRKLS